MDWIPVTALNTLIDCLLICIRPPGAAVHDQSSEKEIPPPTPVNFPKCTPRTNSTRPQKDIQLVTLLQSIHRPPNIRLSHFEALGLHVIPDARAKDLIPDPSFLPPVEEWNSIPAEGLSEADNRGRVPLNNGNLSPGPSTYIERRKEMLIDNTSAFRTIRRIPASKGESLARLGNAYEFYKNLEYFSAFWPDASLPTDSDPVKDTNTPNHLKTHVRSGNGSQLPPEYRQHLLTAFIKLIAYDFGCNVLPSRCEPRLHLTPSSLSKPPSYFNSSAHFIYRVPNDRSSARSGILEGPVAALSARATTGFTSQAESNLDLAREVIAVLLTSQQRARENKREIRFGEGKWWTSKPRWGGGPGGAIGREGDADEIARDIAAVQSQSQSQGLDLANELKAKICGIADGGPSPNKRPRRLKDGNMAIYQPYRKMLPPQSTWDRKARYCAIGKMEGGGHDDVFLVSALNHHVCILRARIPDTLLEALDGKDADWDRLVLWRSKWYDFFLPEERVEAMGVVWGMMAWLMRKVDGEDVGREQMDLS